MRKIVTRHGLRDKIVAMRDAEVAYLVAECGNMVTSDMFLVKGLIHGYDEVIGLIDALDKNKHKEDVS